MAILAAIDVTLTTCAIQTTGKILANKIVGFKFINKITNVWNQYDITLKFKNALYL